MTVYTIWYQRIQEGHMQLRAGSQRPAIINSEKDRYFTRMVLVDRVDTSRALSREIVLFEKPQVSIRTFGEVCNGIDHQRGDNGFGYP